MESRFYFLGVCKFFFAALKSPHTKYYHSSLDVFITLAICFCVLWVRLGKCVFEENIVKRLENFME